MGLFLNLPPNNKSIIGIKLGYVVDDQILMPNTKTHLDKNS